MGVNISTESTLAPVSVASLIIGFISFAFTVFTAVRVFWSEIQTFMAAPGEIPDFLTNLKQSLYEEKWHLRRARRLYAKHARRRSEDRGEKGHRHKDRDTPEWDVALRAMQIAVRHMSEKFVRLEQPFRKQTDAEDGRSRRRSRSRTRFDEGLYRVAFNGDDDDLSEDERCYVTDDYRQCGLKERWTWLQTRAAILSLSDGLTRLTTRRMSIQMTYMTITLRGVGQDMDDIDGRMYNLQQRLSRIVGIRRVE